MTSYYLSRHPRLVLAAHVALAIYVLLTRFPYTLAVAVRSGTSLQTVITCARRELHAWREETRSPIMKPLISSGGVD